MKWGFTQLTVKTTVTHNNFRHYRASFFPFARQPFSKQLCVQESSEHVRFGAKRGGGYGECKGPGKRGHIVADANVPLLARVRNICCGHKFCVWDTKNVSDFVQKHFVSATNVSQFAQPKKRHGQQCVCNNVSSFARALMQRSNNNRNRLACDLLIRSSLFT